jgi:hypothetical protein
MGLRLAPVYQGELFGKATTEVRRYVASSYTVGPCAGSPVVASPPLGGTSAFLSVKTSGFPESKV